jgi:hypothetical protein
MPVLDYVNILSESINLKTPLQGKDLDRCIVFASSTGVAAITRTTTLNQLPKRSFRDGDVQNSNHNSLYFFVNIYQDLTPAS